MDDLEHVVRRVRAGEVEAFAQIVRRFEQPVWRVVAALLQDFEAAGEVVQQVFVDAYTHLGQYQQGTDFAAWIKAIARNRVRMELRRLGREVKHLQAYREQLDARLRDQQAAEAYEEGYFAALRACREMLPEESAQVLQWRYGEGKTFDEIAAAMHKTRTAVEKLLSRIRIGLRQCIEKRLGHA